MVGFVLSSSRVTVLLADLPKGPPLAHTFRIYAHCAIAFDTLNNLLCGLVFACCGHKFHFLFNLLVEWCHKVRQFALPKCILYCAHVTLWANVKDAADRGIEPWPAVHSI